MAYIYAGFLSYAHADEAVAARLHKALETYKVPKGHSGKLSPIFRDANELTAHHSLSEKIKDAVEGSRVLIVLCSPTAKASHWVNEEIRLFRKIHGEASILCVLAEGTPDTSFPPALLEGGREPLAANLGETKTSFQLGVTQISAAMLGVGLDTLIQRGAQRKRRRLQAVTAGALLFSTIMGVTTFSAVTARKAAETNRMQAEGLVEYMIRDMKEKLEPVGRLDILDGIGQRAVEYYEAQDIAKLPDDSLARQARARHILGQVALDAGDYDKARIETQAASRLTKEVYDRNPNDTDAIFAHAQSEYWVGAVYYYEVIFAKKGTYADVLPHWENYSTLSQALFQKDQTNFLWVKEDAWGANNLALLKYKMENLEEAKMKYLEAEASFENALRLSPNNTKVQIAVANVWAGLANIASKDKDDDLALSYRRKMIGFYQSTLEEDGSNYAIRFHLAKARNRFLWFHFNQIDEIEFQNNLSLCLEEYDALLSYDPSNKKWSDDYNVLVKFLYENRKAEKLRELKDGALKKRLKEFGVF